MQETQVWFLGREDPLEKEMANHSSVLAWRIPSGLQSMGLQESVRHYLAAKPRPSPTTMLTSIEPRTWEETSSDRSALSLSPLPPPLLSTALLCELSNHLHLPEFPSPSQLGICLSFISQHCGLKTLCRSNLGQFLGLIWFDSFISGIIALHCLMSSIWKQIFHLLNPVFQVF